MTSADARTVAGHALRASRKTPSLLSHVIGWLLPARLLAIVYVWLQSSGRGEVWLAETKTAMAAVVGIRRGAVLEAVDFFSTGEMLGLDLAVELLRRADDRGLTVILDARGSAREAYFRRLGFEPVGGGRMRRRPVGGIAGAGSLPR